MRSSLLLALLLLAPPLAHADTDDEVPPPPPAPPAPVVSRPHVLIAGGVALGASTLMFDGVVAEGVFRLGGPAWALANVQLGDSFDFEGGGGMERVTGGLELRDGDGGFTPFVDAVVGWQRQTWTSDPGGADRDEVHAGVLTGARFGFDAGGAVRFRLALELLSFDDGFAHSWHGDAGLSMTVGYRF